MENPLCWNQAERVIAKAIEEYQDRDPESIGLSLPAAIGSTLEEAGLIAEKGLEVPENQWPNLE